MKIKEGGVMDIQKEIDRLDVEITDLISDFSIEHFLPNVGDDELEIIVAKAIKFGMLVAERDLAKAQAVPELTDKMIVAIEQTVENQLQASGINADPFRLDGEKIWCAAIEAGETK